MVNLVQIHLLFGGSEFGGARVFGKLFCGVELDLMDLELGELSQTDS
jgi:hypothetical protein